MLKKLKLKKGGKTYLLILILCSGFFFSNAQVVPAVIPYETLTYGTDAGTITTNCATKRTSCGELRVTVWDGATSGLHWILGAHNSAVNGNVSFVTPASEPDVTIIEACGGINVLVVYAKVSFGSGQYFYDIYRFDCANPLLTLSSTGAIDPAVTNDVGIHVDADQSGNFAIAYSIGTSTTNKIWTVIGTSGCNGIVFCPTQYMINPTGTPVNQTDPDVCIQQALLGTSAIKYSYLNIGHNLLCIQGEKHPGTQFGSCFEFPPPNSAVYTYTAQTSYKLYSPRIAAPKNYYSSSLGDDYSVVFLEKKYTGQADRFYIRGYTWKFPGPNPIPICPGSPLSCNGVKTYNDGNTITSPGAPSVFQGNESEYPVITYSDENSCKEIIVGWNVYYGAPGSSGNINWDPVVIQLRINGQQLAANNRYYQVPQGIYVKYDQKAFSIDGRFSDDGPSSIQYSLFDQGPTQSGGMPSVITGKFIGSPFANLRTGESSESSQNSDPELEISPNPGDGNFSIQYSNLNEPISEINIFDLSGRSVKLISNPVQISGTIEINASDLSKGIYFVEVLTNADKFTAKMIIE